VKRKKYADYIEALVETENVKWVTDSFCRDRRIALYGIGLAITQELSGKVNIDPVIPCAGPLGRLMQKHTTATAFKFDRSRRKWKVLKTR
jgi:hypothetical protein